MPDKIVASQYPSLPFNGMAFIAEAPGDTEVVDGLPLVGPAGRQFNALLRSANIDRRACFVSNVIRTKLPDNEVDNAMVLKATLPEGYPLPAFTNKYLSPDYLPDLELLGRELAELAPRLIVCMGRLAVWAFSGFSNIGKVRGVPFFANMIAPGVKCIGTYHPSSVFHAPQNYAVIAQDLDRAVAELHEPGIVRTTPRAIHIEPSLDDLLAFEPQLAAARILTIDIETAVKWRQIKCVGFGIDQHTSIVVPFTDFRQPNRSYWPTIEDELAAWDFVRRVCGNPVPKALQNGAYDIYWLWELMGIPVLNYRYDTMLVQHALYCELPAGLDFIGAQWAREIAWKTLGHNSEEKPNE